jgi:predicted nucleotidyltransferase
MTSTITDGSITKEIVAKADGTVTTQMNTGILNKVSSTYTAGDVNTTVDSNGDIETSIVIGSSAVKVKLDTTGKATSTVEKDGKTTQIQTSTVASQTAVDSSGNVKTTLSMQNNKAVELEVDSATGVLTPTIIGVNLPSSLPAGTKATITSDSKVKFELTLPASLTFN